MANSFDLFDTLIGRKCGTAEDLFDQMGYILRNPYFKDRRKTAERSLQDQKIQYSLADIYQAYDSLFDTKEGANLYDLEWSLELQNVFPIKRNVKLLRDGDYIISDMYLSEEQLRKLIKQAGIQWEGPLIVSCYGKHTGNVWQGLKGKIRTHMGDNPYSDIHTPISYGIDTRPANTDLSRNEKIYLEHSRRLAYWVRHHRLEHIVDEKGADHLNYLQIELNAPLLRAACEVLKDFLVYHKRYQKLLFMSRDTQLFHKMWTRLVDSDSSILNHYIYISRECLRGDSKTWFSYFNARLTPDHLLIDLASGLGSLHCALPKLAVQPNIWTMIFLPGFKTPLEGINLFYATNNMETRINNTWLEMLNYARHWHVADVIPRNPNWVCDNNYDVVFNQENEYDMEKVFAYHQIFQEMLDDMPISEIAQPKTLIRRILPVINQEGTFLQREFPNHLTLERTRKKAWKEA